MFELVEEALHEIAPPVEAPVDGALDLSVSLRWDVGERAAAFGGVEDVLGVVASVGDEVVGPIEAGDQRNRGFFVGGLSRRQSETDR